MITDPEDVKVLVKANILPADLEKAIEAADDKIMAITGRPLEDWQPTDIGYGQLQIIGSMYAAWKILMGWDAKMYLDRAKQLREGLDKEIEDFRKMPLPENRTNPEIKFGESAYTTPRLNKQVKHFMSEY